LQDLKRDEEPPKASLTAKRTDVEVASSTVNVELSPELIKKLTAAAKASGESETDWIHDAIAEAISRRSKRTAH
jgi:predicted HicB family RNase H-like nuclease